MSFLNNLLSGMTGHIDEIADEAILVDVRNPDEHAQGVIEGSVLLPLSDIQREASKLLPNKDTPIVVYCVAGMRAMSARSELLKLGYSQVFNGKGIGEVANQTGKAIVKP